MAKTIGIATSAEKPNLTDDDLILVEALKRKGIRCETIIWDEFDLELPKEQVRALQKWGSYQKILVRSIWDYYKKYDKFLDWLLFIKRNSIPLINSVEVIRWNSNKSYLKLFIQNEIPVIPSIFIVKKTPFIEFQRILDEISVEDFVLKPAVSASAYLTIKTHKKSFNLKDGYEKLKRHSDIILQPFIESVKTDGEISMVFFKQKNKVLFSHAFIKKPAENDFRVQAEYGGNVISHQPSTELLQFGEKTLHWIRQDWCFARVDLLNWKSSPIVNEVELIEPDLFFRLKPTSADMLADIIAEQLK